MDWKFAHVNVFETPEFSILLWIKVNGSLKFPVALAHASKVTLSFDFLKFLACFSPQWTKDLEGINSTTNQSHLHWKGDSRCNFPFRFHWKEMNENFQCLKGLQIRGRFYCTWQGRIQGEIVNKFHVLLTYLGPSLSLAWIHPLQYEIPNYLFHTLHPLMQNRQYILPILLHLHS